MGGGERERERGRGVGAEDAGKYQASLAIPRKTLIPRQEGGIVLLSALDVEKKNLEFTVSKEKQRDEKRKKRRQRGRDNEYKETKKRRREDRL